MSQLSAAELLCLVGAGAGADPGAVPRARGGVPGGGAGGARGGVQTPGGGILRPVRPHQGQRGGAHRGQGDTAAGV